jgi:CDP-paratose 2-epimerase
MKCLVTGSSGLVGSEAVKLFREEGWEVIGIDNNARAENLGTPDKVPEHNIDIRDWTNVSMLFDVHNFDAIVHAAAQASHDWSKEHPVEDFTSNAWGTLNLLEATRKFCPKAPFVYVSSDKVYGEQMTPHDLIEKPTRWHSNYPFDELLKLDDTMRTPFGCSKLAADLYVQEYAKCYGMKTVCFRCGCITGSAHEGAELHGFLAYLVKCIKEGKTYRIFGYKGKQVRDQIHGRDLARAFLLFIKNPKSGGIVFNMGGGVSRSVSVMEAAEMISKKLGKPFISEYVDEPRQGDRIWDIHDITKFKTYYPEFKYEYDLEQIIDDLIAK